MTEIALKVQMENSSYSYRLTTRPGITRGGVSNSSGRFATSVSNGFVDARLTRFESHVNERNLNYARKLHLEEVQCQ